MRKNKKFIIIVSAICVLILLLANIIFQNKPQVQEGANDSAIEVVLSEPTPQTGS